MKRIKKLILLTAWMLLFAGCGNSEGEKIVQITPAATETPVPTPEPVLSEKSFLPAEEYVRTIGRTMTANDSLWLVHSGTGCEFTVN